MDSARFARAVRAFEAVSAEDPAREIVDGAEFPREVAHSRWLADWVDRLAPEASEALKLAAHCQHIGRFRLPRASYPEGRAGYLHWRSELARRHAETAGQILGGLGYDSDTVERVRLIVLKQNLKTNPEAQVMEDALCLAFLEHEFAEFAQRHQDSKLVEILRKTWRKLSPSARDLALSLPLGEKAKALLGRALSAA